MKACFLVASHPPEPAGGTEMVVVALARELRQRGVEVVIVSGTEAPLAGAEVLTGVHDGVTVHRLPKRPEEQDRAGFVRPRLVARVRELLARERPDVLHAHSLAALGVGFTAVAAELGIPLVMTFHDLWVTCARFFRVPVQGVTCPSGADRGPCAACVAAELRTDPGWVGAAIAERDRLVRAEVAAARRWLAPSARAAAMVREWLPFAGPIDVVPHGLLRPVAAAERALPPQPGERLRVGTFGGLVAEKGVGELLDAVAGLPVELHLSGRIYHEAIAARIASARRAGVDVRVRGPYTPAEPHPARDLHLAVFPSKCQETYGLVVDEALAHGVPVVCSDAGALAERRGAGGVEVVPLAALSAALRELVGSPARLAALRAAIPARLPTIAAAAERHLAIYRSLS